MPRKVTATKSGSRVQRGKKIAKQGKKAGKGKGPANPKSRAAKGGKRGPAPDTRRYYSLQEDALILDGLRNKKAEAPQSSVSSQLAIALDRSAESVRDRVKRYLAKLSGADAKEIAKQAKKSPESYAHFKTAADGHKKLDKVSVEEPSLVNRELKRRPRTSKKPKTKQSAKRPVKFDWLQEKINAQDPFFATDHSVHLINALFAQYMEEGWTRQSLEDFVKDSQGAVSLNEILRHFSQ